MIFPKFLVPLPCYIHQCHTNESAYIYITTNILWKFIKKFYILTAKHSFEIISIIPEEQMKAKAHIIGGLVLTSTSIYLLKYYNIQLNLNLIETYSGCFLGSLLPDIDHKKSMLGSIIHLPVKHRTFTHSLLFLLIVTLLSIQLSQSFALGLSMGVFSHMFLDMIGKHSPGICLLYPSKKKFRFFRIK